MLELSPESYQRANLRLALVRPAEGAVWADASGNGYNHTIKNAKLTYVDGVKAYCPQPGPDESSFYAEIEPTASFTYGSEYTLIAWARLKSKNSRHRTLWRSYEHQHALLLPPNDDRIGAYDNSGVSGQYGFLPFGEANADTLGLVDRWAMWTVVTKAGSSTVYYDDGQGGYSIDGYYTIEGHKHWRVSYGSQNFGCLSSAFVWDRAFSKEEVEGFYYLTKHRKT